MSLWHQAIHDLEQATVETLAAAAGEDLAALKNALLARQMAVARVAALSPAQCDPALEGPLNAAVEGGAQARHLVVRFRNRLNLERKHLERVGQVQPLQAYPLIEYVG